MQEIITAIETVTAMPAYSREVMAYAPANARYRPGPIGVFMGYDFHLGGDGPRLIEINTNAGGGLVNAYVLAAQQKCCAEMSVPASVSFDLAGIIASYVESFRSEWERQGRTTPLRTIAIVDTAPASQYLYPEFVVFQRIFEQHGFTALIADAKDLTWRDGALRLGAQGIDLVYDRLTDFSLSQLEHKDLAAAYLAGAVVVTPNPWVHAQFADKRNLALLSNADRLRSSGVDAATVARLTTGIPRTTLVTRERADDLWARRGKLFFKPSAGFGSKATYRGDKITKRVWNEILDASYVAQELVPPSSRAIAIDGKVESMKADLRCYTYAGRVQLIAARLYQGQTTNFRTPGGGFAPVFVGVGSLERKC